MRFFCSKVKSLFKQIKWKKQMTFESEAKFRATFKGLYFYCRCPMGSMVIYKTRYQYWLLNTMKMLSLLYRRSQKRNSQLWNSRLDMAGNMYMPLPLFTLSWNFLLKKDEVMLHAQFTKSNKLLYHYF